MVLKVLFYSRASYWNKCINDTTNSKQNVSNRNKGTIITFRATFTASSPAAPAMEQSQDANSDVNISRTDGERIILLFYQVNVD